MMKKGRILWGAILFLGSAFWRGPQPLWADITSFPPATRMPKGVIKPREVVVQIEKDNILLENGYFSIRLSLKNGLRMERLFNRYTESETLLKDRRSALFLVLLNGEWLGSDWFDVVATQLNPVSATKKRLLLKLHYPDKAFPLNAELAIEIQDSPEIEYFLQVTNAGSSSLENLWVMFPMVERILVGKDPKEDYYFYPFLGGWSSNRSYEIATLLFANPLRVMSVFSPEVGGGIYIYLKDKDGSGNPVKVTHLRKSNVSGEALPSYLPFFPPETKHIPSLTPSPFPAEIGTSFGIRTFQLRLEPGQTISSPPAVLGVSPGDFRQPLESYSRWVRTWWLPPSIPQWLKESFNFVSVHDHDALKSQSYLVKPNPYSPDQVYQWGPWWRHSDLDREGKNPRTDRWYKYNLGDYDYEERWGGLPAFRKEVERIHQEGLRITVLVQSYLLWKHSEIAKKYYQKWGYLMPDGKYNEDYSDPPMNSWGICTLCEEWQDWIAGICGRLIREANLDGIYLDSASMLRFDCINPNHPHPENPLEGIKNYLAKVRQAIKKENPEAILWVEHPGSEYVMSSFDITWLSTFSIPPYSDFEDYGLHFLRFYFPELKYAEWHSDSSKPELWRRTFFNGIGMGIFYTVSDYLARTGQIMRENAKAFNTLSPQPLIPTLKEGVFANLFPTEGKEIYTVWNRNPIAVSGPLLKVKHQEGCHYVELLSGREVDFETEGGEDLLSLEIAAREVACIARFPKLLEAKKQENILEINLRQKSENTEVRMLFGNLPADEGITLSEGRIELDKIGGKMLASPQRIILKLFQNGELVDQVKI